jgi:hypothetical protein
MLTTMSILVKWLVAISLNSVALAQYFPPTPEGLKVVNSKHQDGVQISYKEVGYLRFTCLKIKVLSN